MQPQAKARYDARAKVVKAMAHPRDCSSWTNSPARAEMRVRIDRDDRSGHVHRLHATWRS